jgi:hypothetical protein
MIALSREAVRQFRLVAQRCRCAGRPRLTAAPVEITGGEGIVTLRAHLGEVVVLWRMGPTQNSAPDSIAIPLAELEKFEGTRTDMATLESSSSKRAVVRWRDKDGAASTNIDLTTTELPWPGEPEHLISLSPDFLQALHEAGRTTHRDPDKYAVNRICVRGKLGQLAATDGKQALIQGGFKFPFSDDLLIPAIPAFGCKEVAIERAISVGVVENWLYLVVGPWKFWLAIDREGRFPDLASAIPKAPDTRIALSDSDAQRVLDALPKLPVDKDQDPQSLTLDLGQRAAIRARAGAEGDAIEVPLPESSCRGPDMLVVVNRDHFGRALAMGFREFRCASPERPMVATDCERTYISATIAAQDAVPAPAKATGGTNSVPVQVQSPSSSHPFPRSPSMANREPPVPERNGHPDVNGEIVDPLAEAEGLRVALGEAQARVGRLATALRGFRKQQKTVSSALASLRSLRLE